LSHHNFLLLIHLYNHISLTQLNKLMLLNVPNWGIIVKTIFLKKKRSHVVYFTDVLQEVEQKN
jgi:hypothetical protein